MTGPGSTAFGSTRNGASASGGRPTGHTTWKLWTTTSEWRRRCLPRTACVRCIRARFCVTTQDARLVGQRAVQGARRAGGPHHCHPARATRRHRRHGAPAGALLRDDSTGLAELAANLRLAPRADRGRAADRRVRTTETHSRVGPYTIDAPVLERDLRPARLSSLASGPTPRTRRARRRALMPPNLRSNLADRKNRPPDGRTSRNV